MIGLDTSAIIDLFKGEEAVKNVLVSSKEALSLTFISYLELYFGLDSSNNRHREEGKYYDEFFSSLPAFELSIESCQKASHIYWNLKKQGKTIDQFDCVIASIFLANGVTKILTRNRKHFEHINGLSVISY